MNINRFRNILKIILCFVILLFANGIFSNSVYASHKTKGEIGEYIAEFAVNFAKKYSEETVYSWDAWQRGQAYHGIKTTGYSVPQGLQYKDMYAMDCVGFVSFAIHQSTGLDVPMASNGASGFVVPQSNLCNNSNGYFEIVQGSPQPGDILIETEHHVMVYVGNGKVVDSQWDFSTVQLRNAGNYDKFARITNKGVEAINDSDLTTVFKGQGSITGNCYENSSSEYNGLGQGKYGAYSNLQWILNCLADILDWFIGIVSLIIRSVFIGWTSIVEGLINKTMEVSGGEEGSITIEKLVNNKVPLLDVNFFDFENAGGQKLDQDSAIYAIRQNIAAWYNIIRNISIIGLLITLIYLGIRMATSSIAEQKAKYKELLVSWTVSFAIVIFIHYFMIIILNLNNALIDIINAAFGGGEESLYDTVRNGAYSIQSSVGWRSLVMYMVLVYLLIKFLYLYIKRFIVVGVLTFMAPVIGVVYSIDKIKDNKAQSFSNWLKEYGFNVIIQSVHCLLYTLFISLALNVAEESFTGVFFALILINFMFKAEGLFKKIFGIKSGSLKDVLKTTFEAIGVKKAIGTNMRMLGKVASPITKPIMTLHNRANAYRRSDKIEKVREAIDKAKEAGRTTVTIGRTSSGLKGLLEGEQELSIDSLLEENGNGSSYKMAKDLFAKKEKIDKADRTEIKQRASQALNTTWGVAKKTMAVPMAVVDTGAGMAMFMSGMATSTKGIKGYAKTNKNYKGPKLLRKKMKTLALDLATAGAYSNIKTINKLNRDHEKTKNNAINDAQYEIIVKKLDKNKKKEYKNLLNNPNIDMSELQLALQQSQANISEETIQNVIFRVNANMQIDVFKNVAELAAQTTDIKDLNKNMDKLIKESKKDITIDKKQFNNAVKSEIKIEIAKNLNVKPSSITKEQVEKSFKNLSRQEKTKILSKALMNSSTLKNKKLTRNKDTMDLVKKIESISGKITNLDELKGIAKKEFGEIDKDQLYKQVRKQLRKSMADDLGVKASKVKYEDVDLKFSNLSKEEKRELIEKAFLSKNGIIDDKTKKINQSDLQTNMTLKNVETVIDSIDNETKAINNKKFKNNFKDFIKAQIHVQQNTNMDDITDADIDNYIAKLSHAELVKNIKEVSTWNSSVMNDNLINKSEYKKILDIIEKKKYYENKMKGKK